MTPLHTSILRNLTIAAAAKTIDQDAAALVSILIHLADRGVTIPPEYAPLTLALAATVAPPNPGSHRHMDGKEIRELMDELRVRAPLDNMNRADAVTLTSLLSMCLDDVRLPPFARWILSSCAHHLAPAAGEGKPA